MSYQIGERGDFKGRDVVHEFEAGRKTIRASVNQFRGKTLLDVREFYEPEPGAGLQPTKHGISIPAEYLDDLQEAVAALAAMVRPPTPPRRKAQA